MNPIIRKSKTTAGQTPALLEQALNSPEAIRTMMPEVRRRALADLAAAKRSLEGAACSAAWMAECWQNGTAFPPPAETTPMRICRCERCVRQGRRWPSFYESAPSVPVPSDAAHQAINSATSPSTLNSDPSDFLSYECYLESLDDWTAAQLPSSPSGLALRAVREGRIKLRRQRTRLGRPQRASVT